METAQNSGFATGIVTTASVIDATPGAFYAHAYNRYIQDSVLSNFMKCKVDFIIGGGKKYFDGTDSDSRYVLSDLKNRGFEVYDALNYPVQDISTSPSKRVLCFTGAESALLHSLGFDHLSIASDKAINYLNRKADRYFLMIEGAQIDWAGHARNTDELLLRMDGFDKALKTVIKKALKEKDTLVLVTADHATGGMTIHEGSKKGNLKLDFSTNAHTGTMVPIFAIGPGAENFKGVMDNTEIYTKMMSLLDLNKTQDTITQN